MDLTDLFWVIVTQLGEDRFYIVILSIVYLFMGRKIGAKACTVVLLNMAINAISKDFFKMPRPAPELWKYAVEGYGFPSGHAQGSIVLWGYMSYSLNSIALALLSLFVVLLVSYSRIALEVHYFRDIVGGWGIGACVLIIAIGVERLGISTRLGNWKKHLWLFLPVAFFLISYATSLGIQTSAITNGVLLGVLLGYFFSEQNEFREPTEWKVRAFASAITIILVSAFYFIVIRQIETVMLLFLASAVLGFSVSYFVPLIEDRCLARRS